MDITKSIVIQFFEHLTCVFVSTWAKSLFFYKPFLPNIETESVIPDILSITDGPYYSSMPETLFRDLMDDVMCKSKSWFG